MKKLLFIFLLIIQICFLHAKDGPTGLVCNLLVNPELTVITNPKPNFGWILPSDDAYETQFAYQILVASSPSILNDNVGDLWDTGKLLSSQSQHIEYNGKELIPLSKYYWKVACWNSKDEKTSFSKPQEFNTGEFNNKLGWRGESKWVKIQRNNSEFWTFEDRNPISYHTVYPRKTLQNSGGTWFIDFGRSSFAYAKFSLYWPENKKSKVSKKSIMIRVGEKSVNDSIDQKPGGGVLYKEYSLQIRPGRHEYTLEVPRFVSNYPHSQVMPEHMPEVIPFRYCEIVAEDSSIMLLSANQFALHTVFDDSASSFSSSCLLLNDVYDLCKYSIKVNTFNGDYAASQRERMMYEADSYIHQMGHYAVDREFSVARYSLKNMIFHATWPTEWIFHTIMMAWADYLYTGDKEVINDFYQELKPKTLLELKGDNNLISTRTGLQSKAFLASIHFNGKELKDIVDWPHQSMSEVKSGGETDGFDFKDYNTVVNAFHFHSLVLMSKIAEATAHWQDVSLYKKQAEKVKNAFNKYFFDTTKGYYVDGIGSDHASLHSNMFALAFGLVPESEKSSVLSYIKSKGMACGVYGANYLLEALFDAGEVNYALELITSRTDRSWYNMMRVGSTMTTEAWDNKYKTNNGWSHAWSSSPAHIIPRKLMGIEPLEPGFKIFRVKPALCTLKDASLKVPTIRGEIKVDFTNSKSCFKLNVSVPGNTKAQVFLPIYGRVTELIIDGVKQKTPRNYGEYMVINNVGSGMHQFELRYL